jgi:hypothetical protein
MKSSPWFLVGVMLALLPAVSTPAAAPAEVPAATAARPRTAVSTVPHIGHRAGQVAWTCERFGHT